MKRFPTYLYRVKNSKNYFFRVRSGVFQKISYDNSVSQGHFVASLRTSVLDEAMWLAQFILRKLKEDEHMEQYQRISKPQARALNQLNDQLNFDDKLFEMNLRKLLRKRFNEYLEVGKRVLQTGVIEPEALCNLRTVPTGVFKDYYSAFFSEPHPSLNMALLDQLLKDTQEHGIAVEPFSADAEMHNRLIAELQKLGKKYQGFSSDVVGNIQAVDAEKDPQFLGILERLKDFRNFGKQLERAQQRKANTSLQLKRCVDDFLPQKAVEVNSDSAMKQYKKTFAVFFEVFDHEKLITEFTPDDAVIFKNVVIKLPSGRKSRPTVGVKTVNKYLSNISQLFEWAIKNKKVIKENPFKGTSYTVKNKHSNKRREFRTEEIDGILSYAPRIKREARAIRDAAKWFPRLGLYTGARLNEIAHIRCDDVCREGEIYYFNLLDLTGKTDNASRIIPIHSKLEKMGFLDYVEKMRAQDREYLFPELWVERASRDGRGQSVGKWFNRQLLRGVGIDKSEELHRGIMVDFHCCRHTVASSFKYHGIDGYIAKQILGHHQDDEITWGTYAGRTGTKLSILKSAIESLDY